MSHVPILFSHFRCVNSSSILRFILVALLMSRFSSSTRTSHFRRDYVKPLDYAERGSASFGRAMNSDSTSLTNSLWRRLTNSPRSEISVADWYPVSRVGHGYAAVFTTLTLVACLVCSNCSVESLTALVQFEKVFLCVGPCTLALSACSYFWQLFHPTETPTIWNK